MNATADAPRPDLGAIAAEVDAWNREGMRVLTVLDADYPVNLRTVHDRPLCGWRTQVRHHEP